MSLRIILSILSFLFVANVFAQEFANKSIEHDGETREYLFYAPSSYDGSQSYPLVLNYHGLGSNSTEQYLYSGFNTVAEANDFIVVYPQGLVASVGGNSTTHWNNYFGTGVDDIGFADAMLDKIIEDYNIDITRVYSTGMSNGGFMSYMIACELSDRVAAVASVTGTMSFAQVAACEDGAPVAIMQIHGTADGTVPFGGTPALAPSVLEVNQFWKDKLECSDESGAIAVDDINTADNSTASYDVASDCINDKEVILYTIDNGGHSWPGAFAIAGLGNTNQDFNASQTIWEFFERHVHNNPRGGTLSSLATVSALDKISISPNLVVDQFEIKGISSNTLKVDVYNMNGQLIISENQTTIDLSNVDAGMYLVKISVDGESMVKRVVKM